MISSNKHSLATAASGIYERAEQAFQEAEFSLAAELFESVLSADPQSAKVAHRLAMAHWRSDNLAEAARAMVIALRLVPNPEWMLQLAEIHVARSRWLESRSCLGIIDKWVPGNTLVPAELRARIDEEFRSAFVQATGVEPSVFSPLSKLPMPKVETAADKLAFKKAQPPSLGLMARLLQTNEQLAGWFCGKLLLKSAPKKLDVLLNLAVIYRRMRKYDAARISLSYMLWHAPASAMALSNLGNLMCEIGQAGLTVDLLELSTLLSPENPNTWGNLALACHTAPGRHEDSVAAARRSLELRPGEPSVMNLYANSLKATGHLNEALAIYKQVQEANPSLRDPFHNYLLALQYAAGYSADEVAQAHKSFGERFEPAFRHEHGNYANDPDPQRRLRVGFVSPDLRNHAVAYFVEPLWAELGKFGIEIYAYSTLLAGDGITERLKTYVDVWCNAATLDDDALTARIRSDRIDILVDLTGHTGRNRLFVFARKPAPVQVTWLGHPNTTGLTAIDWRLTDGRGDPEGVDHRYSERLWRLPDVFCCYRPLIKFPELRTAEAYQVRPAPAMANGYITFGCCNNLTKVTDPVVALWSRLLLAEPTSVLLVEAPSLDRERYRIELARRFEAHGVASERLKLIGRDSANQYLTYHDIDIALDPFPCNGGTTTCDVLWMGVPLVTMGCEGFMGRMGVTLVGTVGHPEWTVDTEEKYIAVARQLAADIPALNQLRLGMRAAVEASPLMNEPLFARNVATAFRGMWSEWCESNGGANASTHAVTSVSQSVAEHGVVPAAQTLAPGQLSISGALQMGYDALHSGDLATAKSIFWQVHTQRPAHPEGNAALGFAAEREGSFNPAIVFFSKALQANLRPDWLLAIARCYEAIGGIWGARACIVRASRLPAQGNLDDLQALRERLDEKARALCRADCGADPADLLKTEVRPPLEFEGKPVSRDEALAINSKLVHGDLLTNGFDEIAAALAAHLPERIDLRVNLGMLRLKQKRLTDARREFYIALWGGPDYDSALSAYADFLCQIGQPIPAVPIAQALTLFSPNYHVGWAVLGRAVQESGNNVEAAEVAMRRAHEMRPEDHGIANNLGIILKRMGRTDEATKLFKSLVTALPDSELVWSNYLLALQYADGYDQEYVSQEHKAFGLQFEPKLRSQWGNYTNHRDPEKRLRVGFVSPDFRDHAVTYFVEPLWAELGRFGVDIVAYSVMLNDDHVTVRLKTYCHEWHNVAQMDDDELARVIRADAIDILVDLTGHTGRNRLTVFARKPAPVQVTWLGHPNTTGLTAIDWRLTDALGDPPGVDARYSEKLYRLPEVFCCYRPLIKAPVRRHTQRYAVGPTPALRNGYITFGCCNNLAKLTAPVVQLWSELLKNLPTAVLLIEAPGLQRESLQIEVREKFAAHGVGPSRLKLIGRDLANQYLTYNDIDIALDPFPCNGGTTTCDVLWMGVPLVSLQAVGFMGRMGVTLLSAAGHPEWAVETTQDYLRVAAGLASDIDRLNATRLGLRSQVESSPLMNEPRFAMNVASAFRHMWRDWCGPDSALVGGPAHDAELASAAADHGQYEHAAALYNKAMANGVQPDWLVGLARCYEASGALWAARACLARACRLLPGAVPQEWATFSARLADKVNAGIKLACDIDVEALIAEPLAPLVFRGETLTLEQAAAQSDKLGAGDILNNGYAELAPQLAAHQPDWIEMRVNVAILRLLQKRPLEARREYFMALWRGPDNLLALASFAEYLCQVGQPAMAADIARVVTLFQPDGFAGWAVLGRALYASAKDLLEAEKVTRRALALQPTDQGAANNLGMILKALGRSKEAALHLKGLLTIWPDQAVLWSNYLMTLQYADGHDARFSADEHRAFGARFEPALREQWGGYDNDRQTGRRLRVGFASADLCKHPMANFVEPLWDHLGAFDIEVVAYSDVVLEDSVSARLKEKADQWHNVSGLSDAELADRVRADRVDILVDLAGHTAHNRLLAFARKPAPVQVTWLGYPNTTGLAAIDYRLTDERGDKPGVEGNYSESLWRLPDVFCCYRPLIKAPELRGTARYAVQPTPALRNGFITFGSCNNLAKITEPVIALWSRVLKSVPGSILLIEAAGLEREQLCAAVLEKFAVHQIDAERLKLVGRDLEKQYVTYHEIDIALDPFPCNGGTTTCDALWMGVALVAMEGEGFMARMGASLLSTAGYPQWVARDCDQYVATAAALASDIAALDAIRSAMRSQVEASPLMDEHRFAKNIADAFRAMWGKWCAQDAAATAAIKQIES